MKETVNKLKQLLNTGKEYILNTDKSVLSTKPKPEKWSKKEILGHLIDSAINNIQRFTEIQFESKPYLIRKYNQDELVKANAYQNAEITELLELWTSLNNRVIYLMNQQTETTLSYTIDLGEGDISDLRFLMTDYVDHLEHHMQQITTN